MDDSIPVSFQEYFDSIIFCTDLQYIIPSLLSAISTGTVLIASIIGKFWKRPLSSMIFGIILADFIYSMATISVLVQFPESNKGCLVRHSINIFGITFSASWAVLFGHGFYNVLKHKSTGVLSKYLRYYTPISLVLPVISSSCVFLAKNILLREPGVCVYRLYLGELDWFVLIHLQLPFATTITLCIAFYILSLAQLRKIVIEGKVTEGLTLMMYPAILIVCWGPLLSMQAMAELGMKTSDGLAKTLRVLSHLMGFFDALVYGEGAKGPLRACLKSCRRKACPCLRRSKKQRDGQENTGEFLQINSSVEEYQQMHCAKVRFAFSDSVGSENQPSELSDSLH